MNLLLDANLSYRMVTVLNNHFSSCTHVDLIGLNIPVKDQEIWTYAKEFGLIIVTNDEDFINLINIKGFPPKVILLRTGNKSRMILTNLLIHRKIEIEHLQQSTEIGLLELY